MSPKLSRFGRGVVLGLTISGTAMAQRGGGSDAPPIKPTGPAAKKADDLIRSYTERIEKEIEQGRKEVERLRAELHELIDVRYAMTEAIAELRGDLATKGTYSTDPVINVQAAPKAAPAPAPAPGPAMRFHRDFVYGLGSSMPKAPTEPQREQLRRLAPRADLKQMIARLETEVDETRDEVDQLAYKLLELSAGVSFNGMGGMGGSVRWFDSIGLWGGMGGGMGGGMR